MLILRPPHHVFYRKVFRNTTKKSSDMDVMHCNESYLHTTTDEVFKALNNTYPLSFTFHCTQKLHVHKRTLIILLLFFCLSLLANVSKQILEPCLFMVEGLASFHSLKLDGPNRLASFIFVLSHASRNSSDGTFNTLLGTI